MERKFLFDLDGVLIRREKYFSQRFSDDYQIPIDKVLPFFKGDYKEAAVGRLNIRQVLPTYLSQWGWKKSVDDFLTYWFENEREVDSQLLSAIQELRKKEKCYLASDNEKERAKYVMETIGLVKSFDGAFFSCDLGHTKSEPAFFEDVLQKLQVPARDVVYWDDDPKNVAVASGVGLTAFVYEGFERYLEQIKSLEA